MKCQMLYHVLRTCGGGEKNPLDKGEVVTDVMVWGNRKRHIKGLGLENLYFIIIPKIGLTRGLEKKNETISQRNVFI